MMDETSNNLVPKQPSSDIKEGNNDHSIKKWTKAIKKRKDLLMQATIALALSYCIRRQRNNLNKTVMDILDILFAGSLVKVLWETFVQRRRSKGTLCIVSRSPSYLKLVTREMKKLLASDRELPSVKLRTSLIEHDDPDIEEADMVMQVALKDSRNLYLSDYEESQLYSSYCKARSLKASQFFVIVGDYTSEGIESLYNEDTFELTLSEQQHLREFSKEKRFISVGYSYSPADLAFNNAQKEAITEWIKMRDKEEQKQNKKINQKIMNISAYM